MKINTVNQTIKTILLKVPILVLPAIAGSVLGYGFGIILLIIIQFLITQFGMAFLTSGSWVIIKLVLLLISLAFSYPAALKFKLIASSEFQTLPLRVYLKYSLNCLMLYFWIALSMFIVISLIIFLL